MNTNFMILGATDQKLWVFEGFRRSLGRVGMCSNEKELITCVQRGRLWFEKRSGNSAKWRPAPQSPTNHGL